MLMWGEKLANPLLDNWVIGMIDSFQFFESRKIEDDQWDFFNPFFLVSIELGVKTSQQEDKQEDKQDGNDWTWNLPTNKPLFLQFCH